MASRGAVSTSPLKIEYVPVTALRPYEGNARTHSPDQVAQLAAAIQAFGWTNPILVDEDSNIIAGHGRLAAALEVGLLEVPIIRLVGLTAQQKRALALADNKLALNAGWDEKLLVAELQGLGDLQPLVGFSDEELLRLFNGGNSGLTDPDEVPDAPAVPVTQPGDVWRLGRHRLGCGDATLQEHVARIVDGLSIDLLLTDPPYCSGGFQESGRAGGSVGTNATHKQIANDRLSSRGYQALLKTAFSHFGAPYLYAFTDWRMWVWLFDVAESSGYGVRSMICWDKGTPGMGRGWRSQHELILWAAKAAPPFDKHASGQGNVLRCKRTGNKHHTTEKPVEIVASLLATAPFAQTVADPFVGSGTTIIACEQVGRTAVGMEMDAAYVDVCITRWQNFTGEQATLDGRAFADVAAERLNRPRVSGEKAEWAVMWQKPLHDSNPEFVE